MTEINIEENQAINTPAAVESSPSTSPVDEGENPQNSAESTTVTTTHDQGVESQNDDAGKPTRAQRRIHSLIEKLNEHESSLQQPVEDKTKSLPWLSQPQTAEDAAYVNDDGTINLDAYEQVVTQKVTQQVLKQVEQQHLLTQQQQAYQAHVNEWVSDVENVSRQNPELNPDSDQYNPQLDQAFTTLMEKINRDARGNVVPLHKASDVFAQIKEAMGIAKATGQAQAATNIARHAESGAISPGASSKGSSIPTDEELWESL